MRSAFIQLKDGATAFIDGIKGGHECNMDGDPIYTTRSGDRIYWHTYRPWASYTTQMRERLILQHHEEILDPIVETTCTCSICKSAFNPVWDLEV